MAAADRESDDEGTSPRAVTRAPATGDPRPPDGTQLPGWLETSLPLPSPDSPTAAVLTRPISSTRPGDGLVPATAPAARLFSAGDRIGEGERFEIVERLGIGGMGHVYRAVDAHLDRRVAIKLILENGGLPLEQLVSLLKREAKATAKLNHENIVAIFDMDTFEGAPFLVMELLDGQSLDTMMDRSRLTPLRATQIMIQVARGLGHAHDNGIIHRDLKPSNVFILRDGRAKILDFGISRLERAVVPLAGSGDAPTPTVAGVGTPAFMAPEQWRGEPQDGRVDLWAAGVMFFQMLTGRLPWTVPELALRFSARTRARALAPSVRSHVRSLPPQADTVVARALAEEPEGRFQTARELCDALTELLHVLTGEDRASPHRAARVERRPLTLLACSLEGVGALDLDDVVELDQRFHGIAADVVGRAGGAVGTPIGGKFFCCFGYPAVKEDDAQRAVRAALEIASTVEEQSRRDAAPRWGETPQTPRPARSGLRLGFKIGVHTGVVGLPDLAGAEARLGSSSGGGREGLPHILGDVPNVAVAVAAAAPPDVVCVSQATLDLASGAFVTRVEAEAAGRRPRVHRVVAEADRESRFERGSGENATPFVGRESELGFLRERWDLAKAGGGQVVVVRGEAGIGKSRLLQVLRARVVEEGGTHLTCQCWPHFTNSALHPVIQLLRRSMDLGRDEPAAVKIKKIEKQLVELGFSAADAVPLVASLLSIPTGPAYPALTLGPEVQKLRTLETLVSMLLRMSLNRPVLFVVEDMHWIDHSTTELLTMILDVVQSTRVMVLLSARPEGRVPWSARPCLHTVTLDRLSPAATAAMIEQTAEDKLPAEVMARVVAAADGVPLFVEELTRMILDACGNVDGTNPGLSRLSIPGTLHELLLARLDRLEGAGKEVAQIGSVLGREFDYPLVREVSTLDELSLQEGLQILAAAGILHDEGLVPESKYVFKHALIQQAAYQSMVKADRQGHHLRVAKALVEHFAETADRNPELVAQHYAEADDAEQAIPYYERAGLLAVRRSANVDAISHFGAALALLRPRHTVTMGGDPPSPPVTVGDAPQAADDARVELEKRELGFLVKMGGPVIAVNGYAAPEVERVYSRARALCARLGERTDPFPVFRGLWAYYTVHGDIAQACEVARDLVAYAQRKQEDALLLEAHRVLGSSLLYMGELDEGRAHLEEGIRIYDPQKHRVHAFLYGQEPGMNCMANGCLAVWLLGEPERALAWSRDAVRVAEEAGHPFSLAYALFFSAWMHHFRGEHDTMRRYVDRMVGISQEHRFSFWLRMAACMREWRADGGCADGEALARAKAGIDGLAVGGIQLYAAVNMGLLAQAYAKAGRHADALAMLTDAAATIERTGERFYEPEVARLRGEISIAAGRDEQEAEGDFQRALAIARRQRSRSLELRAALSLARLLGRRGRAEEGRRVVAEVYATFTEGLDTRDLVEARALLATGGDPPSPG